STLTQNNDNLNIKKSESAGNSELLGQSNIQQLQRDPSDSSAPLLTNKYSRSLKVSVKEIDSRKAYLKQQQNSPPEPYIPEFLRPPGLNQFPPLNLGHHPHMMPPPLS